MQHIDHWAGFYEWSNAGRRHPTIEAALAWVGENLPTDESPGGLVWGDARLGNMMFGEGGKVTAVLDWEMAAIGPAELDLGWFVFVNRMYTEGLGIPIPEGFLGRDQTVARYAELAGRPISDFDFFEVLAGIRVAAVIMRIGNLMIEMGMLPADNPMPITNPASMVLASMLGLPSPGGAPGWISGHR
jgi:aminoglycoside phosphotransferase (APT) family kinase protein